MPTAGLSHRPSSRDQSDLWHPTGRTTGPSPVTAGSRPGYDPYAAETAALRSDGQQRTRLVQNIRRGHYDLAIGTNPQLRLSVASTELAAAV